MTTTKGRLAQFIIYARDPETVASFYAAVFGWKITGLKVGRRLHRALIIDDPRSGAGGPLRGHIRKAEARSRINGFECIVAVESLSKTTRAVKRHGGQVIETIPFMKGIGGCLRFRDPAGNLVQAFQFRDERRRKATSNKRTQLARSPMANGRSGPRS